MSMNSNRAALEIRIGRRGKPRKRPKLAVAAAASLRINPIYMPDAKIGLGEIEPKP